MRLYIAGKMTGLPHFNIPTFDQFAEELRAAGYDVVSPAELDDPETRAISMASPDGAIATLNTHGMTWGDFLARDVKLITDGDERGLIEAVCVLPGEQWKTSRGARLETFVARAMNGLPVLYRDPNPPFELHPIADLTLFRVWTDEPLLTVAHSWLPSEAAVRAIRRGAHL